jgi:hypothetical protein
MEDEVSLAKGVRDLRLTAMSLRETVLHARWPNLRYVR